MKFRILVFALVTSLLCASVALAHDGPGKGQGKPEASGACKVKSWTLKGTLISAGTDSFQMQVTKSNRHRALVGEREIKVNEQTRIRRNGSSATLASLQSTDRLKVKARGCRPAAPGASVELIARKVTAKAPKPPSADD